MASIIQGFEYDIFISYRQKDNKYDGWVTEFVNNLKRELDATFKEEIFIYADNNPHDGLLETHNVDKSLDNKLKCLIFIPIISQTYCDPKSFAWRNEFIVFNKMAHDDSFGRDIKLSSGNVASRILPVKIHDLDTEDKMLLENELGGELRSVDFIYREAGVNRPLKPADIKNDNQNRTDYRNQINKVANAVKEIINSINRPQSGIPEFNQAPISLQKNRKSWFLKTGIMAKILIGVFSLIIVVTGALWLNKFYLSARNSKTRNNIITSSTIAYEWYKKAEFRLTPENSDDVDSCISFLTKAIVADPLFALAHSQLSRAYSYKNNNYPDRKYSEKAYVEAEKSLNLNPDLAEGYFAKAFCNYTFENKFPHEKTIRGYKKAISLNPKLVEAWQSLGVVYIHIGLTKESFDAIGKALQIDPDNKIAGLNLISCNLFTGKKSNLEQVVELYKQTPNHFISSTRASFLAEALITLDRTEEAEDILSAGIKKDSSNLFINSAYAILLAKNGDKAGALNKIGYCESKNLNFGHSHHAVYNLAVAEALLGNYQESVNKLTWVAENGFPNYTFFRDDPLLISLHKYAPYNELLKKLKISWEKFQQVANE
jgi:tetratricopeptide (TPR) repeat protein